MGNIIAKHLIDKTHSIAPKENIMVALHITRMEI